MCGFVGVISEAPLFSNDLRFMRSGLVADQVRGRDGTGIMYGTKYRSSYGFVKHADCGSLFIDNPRAVKELNNGHRGKRFMIGHNRAATAGSCTTDNAHPFKAGHILLMHNGSLDYGWEKQYQGANTEVDSAALAWALSLTDDPKEVLEKIDGAFMLIWKNTNTGNLYMARNDERPMWLCKDVHGKTLYLASEKGMLTWLMERNNIKPSEDGPYELPVGELHTFDYCEGSIEPIVDTFVPRPTTTSYYDYYSSYGGAYGGYDGIYYGATSHSDYTAHANTRGGYRTSPECLYELPVKGTTLAFTLYGENSFVKWGSNTNAGYLLCDCWHWDSTKHDIELRILSRNKDENERLNGDYMAEVACAPHYDSTNKVWVVQIAYATMRKTDEDSWAALAGHDFFDLKKKKETSPAREQLRSGVCQGCACSFSISETPDPGQYGAGWLCVPCANTYQ